MAWVWALALATGAIAAAAQEAPPPASFTVAVDRHLSVAVGTADLLGLQRALARVEDRALPPRRFDETTRPRRVLGAGYRLAKFFALDLPQDHFVMVLAHEVFGHGARLRELGAPAIGYQFDWPIPYGAGGAATRFHPPPELTRAERLGIATSGIEAQNVLASTIAGEALDHGLLHHREAWLYLESRLAGLRYIRSISPRSRESHDVAAFLREFNEGCAPPACRPVEAASLKRQALLVLADPLLAATAYGVAVTYLVQGRTWVRAPTIGLPRGVRYLPALDFSITPYGPEWAAVHHVLASGRRSRIVFRVGDAGRRRAWGAGVTMRDAIRRGRLRATATADIWRQPPLAATEPSPRLATGGLLALTADVALGPSSPPRRGLHLILQAGVKSDGYAPGESLRGGTILRAGVSYRTR